jgi:PAS domain S-box-containing protein
MTRPSASMYAQLVEHGLDAALLTRPEDGAILSANPAACQLFGSTLDKFRALDRSALVDLTDPRFHAALAERLETGRCQGILPLRRKDGSQCVAAVSSALSSTARAARHAWAAVSRRLRPSSTTQP